MSLSLSILFRQALVLILLAAPVALLSALLHPRPPHWQEDLLEPGEVRLADVLEWENVIWIDARSRAEYEAAHIPGALLLNEDEWEALFSDFLGSWDPDHRVVVYCGGSRCQLSKKVAERLRADLDSENIYVLKGGWSEWSQH